MPEEVSVVMETELAPAVDEVAPEGAAPETEAVEEVADPAVEQAARFDKIEASLERLKGLDPNAVRSALGRISSLQSAVDDVSKRNPLADVDPRLDANETLLTSIADALIASELTDDRMKTALVAARSGLDSAKGARATNRMRAELKDEILSALPKPAPETEPADNPWAQATADVVAELSERLPDFDPNTIPKAVWDAGVAKGTPARAVSHVVRWAEQKAQEPAADRVSARRQAAGVGAPARTGVPANDEDIIARYADGDRTVTQEQYTAANHRLGLD
jgi:hypothetical protein